MNWIKETIKGFLVGYPIKEPIIETPVIIEEQFTSKEKLHAAILEMVGKDASPKNLAPQELSCAEGVSNIIHSVLPDFQAEILSTADLHLSLKLSPHFKGTLSPDCFGLIISPRTETINGHVGFLMGDRSIISNDSRTGTMQQNYTFDSWVKYFHAKGLHVYLFELV